LMHLMLLTTPEKATAKRGNPKTKFRHICDAAKALGIARVTLYRVLMGQYPDKQNLKARYAAFVKQQGGAR